MPLEFRRGFLSFALIGAAFAAWVSSSVAAVPLRAAYVFGAFDASVARVDLDTGDVELGIATVGPGPNRVEVTDDQAFAFVVCSSGDRVDVLDLATESVTGSVPLPAGSNPWTCEVAGDRVFVSGLLSDRVYEIDPWASTVIDEVDVGVAPEGMCALGGTLFVANTGFDFGTFSYGQGTVSAIDLSTNAVVATIPVPVNPQECLALPDGTVHVICTGDFFMTTGAIVVLDAATASIIEEIPIDSYPGAGAYDSRGFVLLGVTTTSFASEIWVYDATTRVFVHDGSDPLVPTLDFYGNLRTGTLGQLYVPNFSQDLLVAFDPFGLSPPAAYVVGDGPIDAAIVERSSPIPLVLSGLWASSEADGVRLSWHTMPEAGLMHCVVERADPGRAFARIADDIEPARDMTFVDQTAVRGRAYAFRVGGADSRGDITWLPAVTVTHGAAAAEIAFARAMPNPFRASTTLRFTGRAGDPAAFEIIDVTGRRVLAHDLGTLTRESVDFVWEGRDAGGAAVAPGAYFVRARLGSREVVERLLRIR